MNRRNEYILEDGTKIAFSTKKLQRCFGMYKMNLEKQGIKNSKENIMQEIAEKCCVSESSIKHWLNGHHAPNDYDKVKDLAKALNAKAEDLLDNGTEMEDKVKMENIIVDRKMDYTSVKNTVRSLYVDMVKYIETYRMANDENFNVDSSALKPLFVNLYISLEQAKLDLPKELYREMYLFTRNYLQQMACYQAFEEYECNGEIDYDYEDETVVNYVEGEFTVNQDPSYDEQRFEFYFPDTIVDSGWKPWTEYVYVDIIKYGEYYEEFKQAAMMDFNCDCDIFVRKPFISDKAYELLEKILKDYIPE